MAAFALVVCLIVLGRAYSEPTSRPLGLYPPEYPSDNVTTVARSKLGEAFFFDQRLSKSGAMSCATCHEPGHGYAESARVSSPEGEPPVRRNAISILNVSYRASLGWDGSSHSLEEQVSRSFSPYGDMGLDIASALDRVHDDIRYIAACRQEYGRGVDVECLTKAIASFERSLSSSGSRFDRYLFGNDPSALTASEVRGWQLFNGRASCINCHDVFHPDVNALGGAYATFSDERFHNLGVGYSNGRMADSGRFMVSRDTENFGAFKTPMLRNVARTAPYMHDGSLDTLEAVVDFYDRGGVVNERRSPGVRALFLSSEEKQDIVAFLNALNSEYYIPPAAPTQ